MGHLHLQPADKCCPNAFGCVWYAASLWKLQKSYAFTEYGFEVLEHASCIFSAFCLLVDFVYPILHNLMSCMHVMAWQAWRTSANMVCLCSRAGVMPAV
jgi:hypothetical protein